MNRSSSHKYLLTIIALIYVAFGLVTTVIGVIIDKFQATYNVPLQVAALLPFGFYLSYGLFSVPSGLLMDRLGAKTILTTGMILMTLGCLFLYLSGSYIMVIAMIFMAGTGVAVIQTAGNPFIRELDIPEKYTSNLTTIIGINGLGCAMGPLLVPLLQTRGLPWNTVYLVFGVFSLVLLILLRTVRVPKIDLLEEDKIDISIIAGLLKNPVIITYALGIFFYVGAEVGTSSYIIVFMDKVHGFGTEISLWDEGSFMYLVFPSASALAVGLFWLAQAAGRLAAGQIMRYISPRPVFIFHSAATCLSLLVAIVAPATTSLVAFVVTGYFTSVLFTSIFSAAIQSFDKYHGAISGILCTAVAGGAIVGFLVGAAGDLTGMRTAMIINLLAFLYVFGISVFGKGKLT
jgi:FHS family L-fucose permease-like MFS transporter